MKYSTSEAMNEVLARRDQVRRKRERRRTAWYGLSVCAILVVLTLAGLGTRAGSGPNGGAEQPGAEVMGSFLLEAKSGGILAVLILTAVLIVLAALLFLRHRRNREPNDDRTDRKSE